MIKHGRNYSKVGPKELEENESFFNEFKYAALTIDRVKSSGLKDEDLTDNICILCLLQFQIAIGIQHCEGIIQ